MENYKLDKTLLTQGEMQDILAGLRSLDSVNGTNRYGQLMEKLSVGSSDFMVGNQSVLIDLSSWNKDHLITWLLSFNLDYEMTKGELIYEVHMD